MSKKVKTKKQKPLSQDQPASASEKKPTSSQVIQVEARITKLTLKVASDAIEFGGFDMRAEQNRRMSIWIKEKEPLVLTINDDIVTAVKVKKCVTEPKGDKLTFANLKFTSNQCQKLVNIEKSETPVSVEIKPDTQGLFAEQENNEE